MIAFNDLLHLVPRPSFRTPASSLNSHQIALSKLIYKSQLASRLSSKPHPELPPPLYQQIMPPSSPSLSLLDNLLILPSASFILGIVFIDTIYDQPSLPLSTRKLYYSTNKETKGLPGWYLGVIQVASLGSFGGVLGGTLGRYWLGEYSKERGGGNRGLVDVAGLGELGRLGKTGPLIQFVLILL